MEKQDFLDETKATIEKAREIHEMTSTKGWKHVLSIRDEAKDNLLNCRDFSSEGTVNAKFEVYRILDDLVTKLESFVDDADVAQENIKKLK